MLISLKKEARLTSLKRILSKKNIDVADRGLPIYFNDKIKAETDLLLAGSFKELTIKVIDAAPAISNRLPTTDKYLLISQTKTLSLL
ncbi:MAG: hypothetical protein V4541_03955 [Bacteroidota bacterium]